MLLGLKLGLSRKDSHDESADETEDASSASTVISVGLGASLLGGGGRLKERGLSCQETELMDDSSESEPSFAGFFTARMGGVEIPGGGGTGLRRLPADLVGDLVLLLLSVLPFLAGTCRRMRPLGAPWQELLSGVPLRCAAEVVRGGGLAGPWSLWSFCQLWAAPKRSLDVGRRRCLGCIPSKLLLLSTPRSLSNLFLSVEDLGAGR